MQIRIPFRKQFELPMVTGVKQITTRRVKYGEVGDWFNAFNRTYVLTKVELLPLQFALDNWKLEGCFGPEDFLYVWGEIHPRKKLDLTEKFYVHFFKDITQRCVNPADCPRRDEDCLNFPHDQCLKKGCGSI